MNTRLLAAVLAVLIALLGTSFFLSRPSHPAAEGGTEASSTMLRFTPGVERWYTNETLGFSFRLADGFSAPEPDASVPGGQSVKVYDASGNLLTVTATPSSLLRLTPSGLGAGPGEGIKGVRDVSVGNTGLGGYAFTTDLPLWGGDGIGVEFLKGGYLYEIYTYHKDEDLINLTLSTFRFSPPTPLRGTGG